MENTNNKTQEEWKLSGDDILKFFRKIFKAGNSRNIVFKNENGHRIFSVNLIILGLFFFLIPILAFVTLIAIVTVNYSLSIEKNSFDENVKQNKESHTETKEKETDFKPEI